MKTKKESSIIENLDLEKLLKKSIQESLEVINPTKNKKVNVQTKALEQVKVLKEALVSIAKTFILKTEKLSGKTKEAHERLYRKYVEGFNQVSSKLDAVSREQIPELRQLKVDEGINLNAIKLHELYFGNISDLTSDVHRDGIPYMRLSRDWGSFENWQFDFRACCLSSQEGWCILYYEPFSNKYMHAVVDLHSSGVPLGGIPILVMDMWSHAYYADYQDDKKSYVNAMMREINWQIIEARMIIAERANLKDLYLVRPSVDNEPQKLIDNVANKPPISPDQIYPGKIDQVPAPGSQMQIDQGVK